MMFVTSEITRSGGAVRRGRFTTTSAGLERVVALLAAGLRLGTLIQMAPSLATGLSRSSRPFGFGLSWGLAALAAVIVSGRMIRSSRQLGPRGLAADVAIAVALLASGPLVVPDIDRIGTWVGFHPAYALSVLMCVTATRNHRHWLAGYVAVVGGVGWYLLSGLPFGGWSGVIGNFLTFVVLGLVGRVTIVYVRAIASDADAARARVGELARQDEIRRAQATFHNGAALMHLLSDPDVDDTARTVLLSQAGREAQRMRSYLRDHRSAENPDRATDAPLLPLVNEVCDEYGDLPITRLLDLGGQSRTSPAVAEQLHVALDSVLLNVRVHAAARRVVVHLDTDGSWWTVTVRDDGVGFDSAAVPAGVGIGRLVHGELGRLGCRTSVRSMPGRGTAVEISGSELRAGADAA